MSDATILAMMRDEYLASTEEKKRKRDEITKKHREIARQNAAAEIEAMNDAEDLKLANMLVRALNSGLKRSEIWKPVFGTNDNDRWRRLVELGGGVTRAKRTGEEILAAEREEFLAKFRYLLMLVDNEHSELGKGILVTARDGEALPEPLNLPLYHVESTGKWLVRDIPDREMPDWWFDLMGAGGYAEFQAEVHEFALHQNLGG